MAIDAKKGLMIVGGVAVALTAAIGAGLYFSFRRPRLGDLGTPAEKYRLLDQNCNDSCQAWYRTSYGEKTVNKCMDICVSEGRFPSAFELIVNHRTMNATDRANFLKMYRTEQNWMRSAYGAPEIVKKFKPWIDKRFKEIGEAPLPASWTKCLPKKGELKAKKVRHTDKKIFYPAGCGCANSGQRCLKK